MAHTKKSTDVNLTVFDILQAVTGELPCYASPNWKVSDKKEDPAKKCPSRAEDQVKKTLGY
jgi:hypothetical protein